MILYPQQQKTIDYVNVNAHLGVLTPLGAYCMECFPGLAWADGKDPGELLAQASACDSVDDALRLYQPGEIDLGLSTTPEIT